jgi:hypothetical protein
VNAVLTKASAGEKLEQGFKVLLIHSAVVRVDYFVYGYTVSANSGIAQTTKNGLVCVATVGVVDFNSIGLETLVYLVGTQCAQVSTGVKLHTLCRGKCWYMLNSITLWVRTGNDWMRVFPQGFAMLGRECLIVLLANQI